MFASVKELQKVPYGITPEEHYGMKVDNGPKLNRNLGTTIVDDAPMLDGAAAVSSGL